jgi:membrane fusion protein, copper/silver efflux system
MHPQIMQPTREIALSVAWDLIPLVDDAGKDVGPREMSMSESSMALAEIQTQVVERYFPNANIRLVGKLEYDESKRNVTNCTFSCENGSSFCKLHWNCRLNLGNT